MIVNKGYVMFLYQPYTTGFTVGIWGSNKTVAYPQRIKSRPVRSERFNGFGKSIDERPDYINNRTETGHFEIDTAILTREKNQCLLTMTDRKSR